MKRSPEFWLRVTAAVFIAALVIKVPSVLFPFGLSLILALLLKPLALWIQKCVVSAGLRRFPIDVSIILSFLVFIAVIYAVAINIIAPFFDEFRQFIQDVPTMASALKGMTDQMSVMNSGEPMPPELRNLTQNVISQVGTYTLKIAQFSLSAIFSFASTVVELVAVPFITFYMMKNGAGFRDGFISLFPERYRPHLRNLFDEIHFVLSAYIRGQLILSTLMAIVIFLGMVIMGVPYPLVIGLLAGVIEMIPVIGPVIGAVPAVLLALVKSTGLALQVIIFYVIVQQLDGHLIMPKVMGHSIRVHPVVIIGGVLLAGHLYGILGMMIAVPVLSVLQVLLRHMWYYERYRNLY